MCCGLERPYQDILRDVIVPPTGRRASVLSGYQRAFQRRDNEHCQPVWIDSTPDLSPLNALVDY